MKENFRREFAKIKKTCPWVSGGQRRRKERERERKDYKKQHKNRRKREKEKRKEKLCVFNVGVGLA